MTIEKGETWGEPWVEGGDGPPPVVVDDDAAVAELVDGRRRSDEPAPLAAPRRGDLLRTLGLEDPRPAGERHRYPIDVGLARMERSGRVVEAVFVAHLTVRNRRLTGIGPGLSVAVMNAAWLGPLRLGPRAHPNDGLLDVTEGTVGLFQRREADRRARSGAHLPHPDLDTRRVARWERRWPRPVTVWLDGVRRGRFEAVTVEIIPDAAAIVA